MNAPVTPAHAAAAATWTYPTTIAFGPGRIAELADACRAIGVTRPLLVTDRGLAQSAIARAALDRLEEAGLGRASFADVDANPTGGNLAAGVTVFREGGHDGVVAFGGGSGLDLGKLVAFMAGQRRPVWDFEDIGDYWTRADHDAIAPIVAVPTTAGTGSEVGRAGVVTNEDEGAKKIVFHPKMLPGRVIADPALTVGMPKAITVGAGMDALAHCVEAYCAPNFHPMSRGVAVEGARLVLENLERAVATPDDLDARGQMMCAAMMGAVAFQKGLGAVHALSHPIGARFHTHHGATNGVVMPAVLDFNRPHVENAIAALAAYCGIEGGFDGFVRALRALMAAIDAPTSLGALGVDSAAIPELAAMAVVDPTAGGNPRPMSVEDAKTLLAASF